MIVPDARSFSGPGQQRYMSSLLVLVFALGTLALVVLVALAFVGCLIVLNLSLSVFAECVSAIADLYRSGGSVVELAMWIVGLIVVHRIGLMLVMHLRRSWKLA